MHSAPNGEINKCHIDNLKVNCYICIVTTEQRGQYHFLPDGDMTFQDQKRPLGMPSVSLGQHLVGKIGAGLERLGIPTKPRALELEDFRWDPETDRERDLLHDALLSDLREKGILGIISRETNVDPQDWADHEKSSFNQRIFPKTKPDVWEVDIVGPRVDYDMVPGPGRWSGGCVTAVPIPNNHMTIQLSIGPKWDERIVNITYGRERNLSIRGAETSVIDLNKIDSKYLIQEHLRDAMAHPYNPYWETEHGFLSPAAFRRHVVQLNASRAA